MTGGRTPEAMATRLHDAALALVRRYGWPEDPELPEWCDREWLALIDAMLWFEGFEP